MEWRTSGLTTDIGSVPRRMREASWPTCTPDLMRDMFDDPAECGVAITLSILSSGLSGEVGSSSNTSRPAPAISPSFQRLYERRFVHDRPSAGVDEVGRLLHRLEETLAYQLFGLAVERRVNGHEVGIGGEFFQAADESDSVFARYPRGQIWVVGDDVHAESMRLARDRARYVAERDQSERLVIYGRHGHNRVTGLGAPLSCLGKLVELGEFLGAGKNHDYGVVGYFLGAEAGCVDDHDALVRSGLVINVVEAVAPDHNRLDAFGLLDDLARDGHAAGVDYDVGARHSFDDLAVAGAFVLVQFVV